MQLDDLQTAWAAHGALLEKNLDINERLLRDVIVRKIRWSLAPYLLRRMLEVPLWLVATGLVGSVLGDHLGQARYLSIGGAVLVFGVAMTAMTAYLLCRVLRLDYSGRVTEIQRQVAYLELVEYRAFKWALLGGIVVWLPAVMMLLEALSGVDFVARADLTWLAANVVFGLLLLLLGQSLSKKYVERPDLKPWARRLVVGVAGRQLESVHRHLAELANFAREE